MACLLNIAKSFNQQKTKRQVSGLSFWFENEIEDVDLSNVFENNAKQKFPFISKTQRNNNKKIKTCPTLVRSRVKSLLSQCRRSTLRINKKY